MDTSSIFDETTSFIDIIALKRFLEHISSSIINREPGKGLSSNDFTNKHIADISEALLHSRSPHAPSNAQENVIERISVNNQLIPVIGKRVDLDLNNLLKIPTNVSDLINDKGFLTTHPAVPLFDNSTSNIDLTYNGVFQVIRNIHRDSNGHINRIEFDNLKMPAAYNHPDSGISSGTFRSVTVNAQGHVIAGTNPTTRDEYGLTDVPTKSEMDSSIQATISHHNNLKRVIVTSLPETSNADLNTIYWIRAITPTGPNNFFDEYMVIEGAWEKVGDTNPDMTGYIHERNIKLTTFADIDVLFL